MARSLEALRGAPFGAIALPDKQDILDLLDKRGAGGAAFDPSYGDTLKTLLPRQLSKLVTRH